ncbi:MAG: hypothetical protein ACLUD0_14905 [Eubacterium ramulus]
MRKIQMMGIDHSRATVAERELFSLTKAKQKELMEAVIRQQGVGGCVLLSTCNRTELYVSLQKKRILICTGFSVTIREIPQTAQDELQHLFCRRSGEDAVRHLFLLTGGLKSRIIGEDQILTQVREALEYARLCNVADTVLKTLFRMAVTVGKKIKTQVAIPRGNTSAIACSSCTVGTGRAYLRGYTVSGDRKRRNGQTDSPGLPGAGAFVTVTVRQYRSGPGADTGRMCTDPLRRAL